MTDAGVQKEPKPEPDDSGDEGAPALDATEQKKAEEEEDLDAKTTYEVIRRMGKRELERSTSALVWSGLAAGLSMGLSLAAEGVLRAHLPDSEWRPLVAKLGYSVGFLVVILGSQQLFTENTLTPIVPFLAKPGWETGRDVVRLWASVLVANLVGTALFAYIVARTVAFRPEVRYAFELIGRESMEGTFTEKLIRAVFAGWLIALLVWMLPAASQAKVWVIILMTWLLGASGLTHVIAGAADVVFLVARGVETWTSYLSGFLAPALIGNMFGGLTLVAALNHAQVSAGKKDE
jgi:formate/nitrite transporter FocA (FNT family)